MRSRSLALLAWVGAALAADVIVLSSVAEFNILRAKQAGLALLVYAPWCGHSKALLPEFEKAAQDADMPFAKVDGTEAEALATKLDVKGYPTLLFIRRGDGSPMEYDGQRTAASISQWVKSKLSPDVKQMSTSAQVSAFTTGKPVALVLFVADKTAPEAEAMIGVAASANLPCAISTASPSDLDLSVSAPALVAYTSHAVPAVMDSSTAMTHSSMLRFGKMHALPSLVTYTTLLEEALFSAEVGLHLLYFHAASLDSPSAAGLSKAGELLRGDAVIASVDVAKHAEVAAFFDVGGEGTSLTVPSLMGFSLTNGTKFAHQGKLDAESIITFARAVAAGDIEPYLRSQPTPSSAGPLVELVGSTFAAVVQDSTKDVLVQFYSPGCGHCEKLKPVYQSVAAKFGAAEDMVVAQIDATANDILGFEPEGYPTIVLYTKANKEGIEYDGSRDAHDLAQFVEDARAGVNHIGGLSEASLGSLDSPDEQDGYRVEL